MENIDQWIPYLLRGKRLPADVVYEIRRNPSLVSPGLTSRRRQPPAVRGGMLWPSGQAVLWPDSSKLLWPN